MHSLSIKKNSLGIKNKNLKYKKKTQYTFHGISNIVGKNIKKLLIYRKKII